MPPAGRHTSIKSCYKRQVAGLSSVALPKPNKRGMWVHMIGKDERYCNNEQLLTELLVKLPAFRGHLLTSTIQSVIVSSTAGHTRCKRLMTLARKLQASRLCSLFKLVVNNGNNQNLHTVASIRSTRLQGSLNFRALPALLAGPRLTWRSVVTLEQAQGQVRHCCRGILCAQTTDMPCIRH